MVDLLYAPAPSPSPSFTPAYIPDPGLHLPSLPRQKESLSLDPADFDQSPVLKKIKDHYADSIPSVGTRVSQLSPGDVTRNVQKKVKRANYTITPSIVSVSSFHGVRRRIDCSGLIVDWNSSENEATILTSAKVLWRPKRSSFEFHLIVRMADGTLLLAREDRVDYYNNLLTLKVRSTVELKAVNLRSMQSIIADEIDVIALGREFYSCSVRDYAGELHLDYPYFGCTELLTTTCRIPAFCEGGPLITHTGCVVGINFFDNVGCAHPLPAPIALRFLEFWNIYSTVVWPWIGVSVVDVDQLPYDIRERYKLVCDEPHVVVKEVFGGSPADQNGVCSGDLVLTCDGIPIRSTKQYSQLLFKGSLAMTPPGDSGQQNFTVVIKPFERCAADEISIEAKNIAVDDMRLNVCWPRVEADWNRKKVGSLDNPGVNVLPLPGNGEYVYGSHSMCLSRE